MYSLYLNYAYIVPDSPSDYLLSPILVAGATKVIKIPSAALLHTAILLAILSHEVVTKILHVSGYDMWIHCASCGISLSFR